MKKSTKIIVGILILIAAIGLLFYAFMPGLAIFTIPLWKWLLSAALVFWIVKRIVSGRTLGARLSVFLPIGLLFILLEKEIGGFIGRGDDFVNNWFVILAAAMIDIALPIIFRNKLGKSVSGSHASYTVSRSASSGTSSADNSVFRLGSHVYYVDVAEKSTASVINQLGELNVYFQNTDVCSSEEPLTFSGVNQMGEMRIHVPRDWHVDLTHENSMGTMVCRPDGDVISRTIVMNIKNQMGEVRIVSDD
ncbi:MAG: hypothetical protein ILO53_03160 [Clostridia bacterium]|nr:hypothetical protein [Clostridia bacterium]